MFLNGLLICLILNKIDISYSTLSTETGLFERDSKVFSLFTVVQFQHKPCTSTMALASSSSGAQFRNGTCMTQPECESKGGSGSGDCAGGFGVCCVFMIMACNTEVTQNCSYVKNPNYPAAYTDTTSCSFTIAKCSSSVCSFRLDFETFMTNGPTDTSETNGGACQDMLTFATGAQPGGSSYPTICGSNAGQHMYLDAGRLATDTATLNFAFTGTANRFWDIKVTQIPCDANYDAPEGCLQYHTGIDGRFTTFNFQGNQHLASQNYRICIRQEEGYCCIVYLPCSDANSFAFNSATNADLDDSAVSNECTGDYLVLEGSSGTGSGSLQSRYCGGILNPATGQSVNVAVRDCTQPFEAAFVTDAAADATATTVANGNSGLCLTWRQEPCATNRAGV